MKPLHLLIITAIAVSGMMAMQPNNSSIAMRTIKRIHKSSYTPIGDLVTYNCLPNAQIQQIDPYLFLNHHGPQVYPPNNSGLPFGPHPHRGMETITFILEGDIMHQDTGNHKSIINAGGVQWMTAGSGLIHAEVSSEAFKQTGGPLEILQLWVNLPRKHKFIQPSYVGKQRDEIPHIMDGGTRVNVLSGNYKGIAGAYSGVTEMPMFTLEMAKGAALDLEVPAEHNIFCYIVRGQVGVNETPVNRFHLVEFANDGTTVRLEAMETAYVIFSHAKPFNEPLVARGPFVMNTEEEIQQAYMDYRQGKFGSWQGN